MVGKGRPIRSILRLKANLIMAGAFTAAGVIGITGLLTGDPYHITIILIPSIGFISLIVFFSIVVCPYCGTTDPTGIMFPDQLGTPERTKCPTCRRSMTDRFQL